MEQFIKSYNIHPTDLQLIEEYLLKKGLELVCISEHINWFAIAKVTLISPADIYEQTEFNVIIDLRKKICCKFDFWDNITDGLKIYQETSNDISIKISEPYFNMSFIKTIGGSNTPYILIQYCNSYRHQFGEDNLDQKVYIQIMDFSSSQSFVFGCSFTFNEWSDYDKPIELYLLDNYPRLFAYRFTTIEDAEMNFWDFNKYSFNGILNTSLWGEKKHITLHGENVFSVADELYKEIEEDRRMNDE